VVAGIGREEENVDEEEIAAAGLKENEVAKADNV
jgi:hypothetical protein